MEPGRYKALLLKRKQLEGMFSANISEAAVAKQGGKLDRLEQLYVAGRVIMAKYVVVIEEIEKA